MRIAALLIVISLAPPALAAEKPVPVSASEKDKLICRRETPIGSLIASRKVCMTKEQWQKRTDDGNSTSRQLVEDGASACGQNGGVC